MVPLRFERRHRRQSDAELWHVLAGPWEGLDLDTLEGALCEAFGFQVRELHERTRGRATSQLRALLVALSHDLLAVSTTELRWRYKVDRRTVGRDLYGGREWVRCSDQVRDVLRRALPRWAHKLEGAAEARVPPRIERPPPPPPRDWRYLVQPDDRYGCPDPERRARLVAAVSAHGRAERSSVRLLGDEAPTASLPAGAREPDYGRLGGVTPMQAPADATWVMPSEDG